MESWEYALAYHEETKHHFYRLARSLGYMDWENQPDPFRRFEGAPLIKLKLTGAEPGESPAYDELYEPGLIRPQPVCFQTISDFFEHALALSAWKQYRDSRWALRVNPSSGNLHPTEGYLAAGPVEGLHDAGGIYHYAPKEHALERRAELAADVWNELTAGLPPDAFLVGLSSIHWREAWKYGERAYRYCQHDVGHALAALAISAAVQGWHARMLETLGDADVARLLGLDRADDFAEAEGEHPDALVVVAPQHVDSGETTATLTPAGIDRIASGTWVGRANRLSASHDDWGLIDTTADACVKPRTQPPRLSSRADWAPSISPDRTAIPARRIIRQRRSAVAMDATTSITAEQFYVMMDRVLPRFDRTPWNLLGPPVCVHLGLFVHRVQGLAPGLYFLVRTPDQLEPLQAATRPTFTWTKPPGRPEPLPLFHLLEGDARHAAGQVSCGQAIAADGAFSLGMIAEFERPLREYGGWYYRRLHWETGAIGQVLYLEAEAAGIRSTGIGCFFDDPVHDVFGLRGHVYQTLYHFTVGGPVEDPRLTTWPPYGTSA